MAPLTFARLLRNPLSWVSSSLKRLSSGLLWNQHCQRTGLLLLTSGLPGLCGIGLRELLVDNMLWSHLVASFASPGQGLAPVVAHVASVVWTWWLLHPTVASVVWTRWLLHPTQGNSVSLHPQAASEGASGTFLWGSILFCLSWQGKDVMMGRTVLLEVGGAKPRTGASVPSFCFYFNFCVGHTEL